MTRVLARALLAVGLTACAVDASRDGASGTNTAGTATGVDTGGDVMDEDIPPPDPCPGGQCNTTGPGAGPDDACIITFECPQGSLCVAPFDGSRRGDFACVSECVANMDEAFWCADTRACCDPDAVCTSRGYCVNGGGTTAGDTGAGTGTTSSTTSG